MKRYKFNITIKLNDIEVEAENEGEARVCLTETVVDYFDDNILDIDNEKVELINITDIE